MSGMQDGVLSSDSHSPASVLGIGKDVSGGYHYRVGVCLGYCPACADDVTQLVYGAGEGCGLAG